MLIPARLWREAEMLLTQRPAAKLSGVTPVISISAPFSRELNAKTMQGSKLGQVHKIPVCDAVPVDTFQIGTIDAEDECVLFTAVSVAISCLDRNQGSDALCSATTICHLPFGKGKKVVGNAGHIICGPTTWRNHCNSDPSIFNGRRANTATNIFDPFWFISARRQGKKTHRCRQTLHGRSPFQVDLGRVAQ